MFRALEPWHLIVLGLMATVVVAVVAVVVAVVVKVVTRRWPIDESPLPPELLLLL